MAKKPVFSPADPVSPSKSNAPACAGGTAAPRQAHWWQDLLLALLVCAAFLLLSDRLIPFDFAVNDDTTMISILNGTYSGTPNGYAVFIGYPLGWFISRLYATGIAICWYKWALMGCNLLGLASVLYRLLRRFPRQRLLSVTAVTGLCSFLWLTQIMHTTYTCCGALAMVCAVVSYGLQTPDEDPRPGYLVSILLLFFLAFQLRDYFGYLTVPFLGVLWLGKHWGHLRQNRACWLVPLTGAICLAVAVGIESAAYSGDWKAFMTYNDARSYLQDYNQFPDYDENAEFITSLGFTKEEYRTLSRYTYALLDDMCPEKIVALWDYVQSRQEPVTLGESVQKALSLTVKAYCTSSLSALTPLRLFSYLSPLALLVCALLVGRRYGWLTLAVPLLLLLGCAGVWLIIAYQGRTPERVMLSLRLITITAPAAGIFVLLRRFPLTPPSEKMGRVLTTVLSGVMVLLLVWGQQRTLDSQSGRKAPQQDYLQYAAQHPDELFVRDIKSTVSGDTGRLLEFPRASVNVLSTGGWPVYSPVYRQKLDTLGIPALSRSLLLEEHVYLLVNLEQFDLQKVLGLPKSAVIDYEVVQVFERNLSMVRIHSITIP